MNTEPLQKHIPSHGILTVKTRNGIIQLPVSHDDNPETIIRRLQVASDDMLHGV